jgi:WW domain-containing oxidoreductase
MSLSDYRERQENSMNGRQFDGRSSCDDVVRGVDLSGRAILVTGATAGIGFETARSLASAGAHVLLGCRNTQTGSATVEALRARVPAAKLSMLELDLASFASVRRCVESFPVAKLDVLICNAGLFASRYQLTEDGIERVVGVCHFGHFLLVTQLLDRLRAAQSARVVMVASESHRHPSRLQFERFPLSQQTFRPLVAYGQAKLCNVLFANELTRRYAGEGIVANSLHPGTMIGTSIFRDSISARLLALAMRPFTKSLAQGAATSVYCAVAPELAGVGGRYFTDCRPKGASKGAQDEAAARALWEASAARTVPSAVSAVA